MSRLENIVFSGISFAKDTTFFISYWPRIHPLWQTDLGVANRAHHALQLWSICSVCLEHHFAARRSNQPILKEISLDIHWKDWCWSSNTLSTWCEELIHWTRSWCWARLRAGGEKGDRGWDGWMASPTQWTWVWASSRRLWRTGKPSVLQSMWWQRVRNDIATERWPQLNSPCEL